MRQNIYLGYSYIQKAVRLSDPELGLKGCNILGNIYRSDAPILKYIKRILLEDVKSPQLLLSSNGETNWKKLIIDLCKIRKQWERVHTGNVIVDDYSAYSSAYKQGPITEILSDKHYKSYAETMETYYRMRRMSPKSERDKNKIYFLKELEKRISSPINKEIFKHCSKLDTFTINLILQIEHNKWEDGLNKMDSKRITPPDENYLHDMHTWRGKKLLISKWKQIAPNKDLPKGIFLQTSGSAIGTIWRYKWWQQKKMNDIKFENWSEVYINQEEWDLAVFIDKHWLSKKFFLSLAEKDL